MSILMPQEKEWLANNWVSRTFFEDCTNHLAKVPQLSQDIQFCLEADIDTLDLRTKDIQAILELKALVALVIKDNFLKRGSNFHSPEYFPFYLGRVKILDGLIEEVVTPVVMEIVAKAA